ncbi:MAG: alginate export family protein [Desulfobacterales bacterium]|nr:alginate export family protein [Desulfobacterales bacterium]
MKIIFRFLIILVVITFCFGLSGFSIAWAGEEKLTFGANTRFRYEYQDNFNAKYYGDRPKKGEANDGFLLGRFRLGFDYRPTQNIHLAVWMQHSEVWDLALKEEDFYKNNFKRENNPYEDSYELYDTYVEIDEIFSQPLSMKLGRQVIAYGDMRIFGPGQWGNTGRWIWDAGKLSYKFKAGFLDAFYGKTQLHDPNVFSLDHGHGFESFAVYSHFKLPDRLSGVVFEPFFMTKDNDRDVYKGEDNRIGELNSYYTGVRIYRKDFRGFDGDFTFIMQDGDYSRDDIDAYGYHFLLAYNFKQVFFKPRLSVEYSYASGDSDPNDGKHDTFDGAFGARDKMYGRINLFHWMNLKDAQVNLEIRPKKWLYLKAEYHQFRLAEKEDAWYLNSKEYRDKTGRSGDKVGKEFDIVGKLKIPQGIEVQFGCGYFWPDEFAKKKASDKKANWVFLQFVYKFSYAFF